MSANMHTSPFEIFEQDVDDVIMIINFYIMLGDEKATEPSRKDDGFWDM